MDNGTGSRNKKLSVGGKWLGLTTISDSTNLPLGALKEATNVVTDVGGMLRKREGFSLLNSAPRNGKAKMIYDFKVQAQETNNQFQVHSSNTEERYDLTHHSILENSSTTFQNLGNVIEMQLSNDLDKIEKVNFDIFNSYAYKAGKQIMIGDSDFTFDDTKKYLHVSTAASKQKVTSLFTWNANGDFVHTTEGFVIKTGIDLNVAVGPYKGPDQNIQVYKYFSGLKTKDNLDIYLYCIEMQNTTYVLRTGGSYYWEYEKNLLLALVTDRTKTIFSYHIDIEKKHKFNGECFIHLYFMTGNENYISCYIKSRTSIRKFIDNDPDRPSSNNASSEKESIITFKIDTNIQMNSTTIADFSNSKQFDLFEERTYVTYTSKIYEFHTNTLKNIYSIEDSKEPDQKQKLYDTFLKNLNYPMAFIYYYLKDRLYVYYFEENQYGIFSIEASSGSCSIISIDEFQEKMKEVTEKKVDAKWKNDFIPLWIDNKILINGTSVAVDNTKFKDNTLGTIRVSNILSNNKIEYTNRITSTNSNSPFYDLLLSKSISAIADITHIRVPDVENVSFWINNFSDFTLSGKSIDLNFFVFNENSKIDKISLTSSVPFSSNISTHDSTTYELALSTDDYLITDVTHKGNIIIINTTIDIFALSFFWANDINSNNKKFFMLVSSMKNFAKNITIDELTSIGNNILLDAINKTADTFLAKGVKELLTNIVLLKGSNTTPSEKVFEVCGLWEHGEKEITPTNYEIKWQLFKDDGTEIDLTKHNPAITNGEKQIIMPNDLFKKGIYTIKVSVKNKATNVFLKHGEDEFIIDQLNIKNQIEHRKYAYNEIKSCKYSEFLNNKLVLYGNGTTLIYTSSINEPFYFYANNIVVADSFGKKEDIVKIADFKDTKIIFTENTMMSMSGDGNYVAESPWHILGLDPVHGSVTHDSNIEIENTLSFQSRDGIYIITQISVADNRVSLEKLSNNLNDLSLPFTDSITITNEQLETNVLFANHENRLIIYYCDKKYFLVYDYSNSNFNEGTWFKWKAAKENNVFVVDPTFFNIIDGRLVMTSNNNVIFKYPKLKQHIYDVDFTKNQDYYTDLGKEYELEITTRDSTFGEVDQFKRVKNITIVTTNAKVGTSDLHVTTETDSQPDLDYTTDSIDWKIPLLGSLLTKNQMTTYRPYDNLHSKTFLKSKNGRLLSISIKENSKLPFEIKELSVELMESSAKNKKIR